MLPGVNHGKLPSGNACGPLASSGAISIAASATPAGQLITSRTAAGYEIVSRAARRTKVGTLAARDGVVPPARRKGVTRQRRNAEVRPDLLPKIAMPVVCIHTNKRAGGIILRLPTSIAADAAAKIRPGCRTPEIIKPVLRRSAQLIK